MGEKAAGKLGLPAQRPAGSQAKFLARRVSGETTVKSPGEAGGQPGILRLTDWHQRGDQAQQANLRPLSRIQLCSLKANPEVRPQGLRSAGRLLQV